MMQRPILVTGPHRSGTTWTARMIAAAPGVGYIQEPFNPAHRPGVCTVGIERYFLHHAPGDHAPEWDSALEKTLAFQYDVAAELSAIRSAKDVLRMTRDYAHFAWHRWLEHRPLMKDPIALFSAEWVAERFDADVVVLIRHPAAFVSSLKRLEWTFPFEDMLSQPKLMERHLKPFTGEIETFAYEKRDIIDQGALLWKIFHHVILQYRQVYGDGWLFLRLEDLASHPGRAFRQLYERLGLEYSASVQRLIRRHTRSKNPTELSSGDARTIKRDSRSAIRLWKRRLTSAEIGRIREATADVPNIFYGEEDWA